MIIKPTNLDIKTSNILELNTRFNTLGIWFTSTDDYSVYATYGNYDPFTDNINIQVPQNADLTTLNSVVSHELIHKEQNRKSKNRYSNWLISYGKELNKKIKHYNLIPNVSKTANLLGEIHYMNYVMKYSNSQELMAYAYQFVATKDLFDITTIDELFKYVRENTQIPVNNTFKSYANQYWELNK